MSLPPDDRVTINFFRPEGERLRREVAVIRIVLLLWALIAFGLPLFVWLCGLGDPLVGTVNMHAPKWLLAQGATLGFVLLCKLYTELLARALRKLETPWHAPAGQGGGDV